MSQHKATNDTDLADRYSVSAILGEGGFGTTYAAVDTETGESVAVKALDLSRVDDWKAVELFEREARVLEQLDHPNIPDYRDFIPVRDDATGYLVQSLAPGQSLAEHLDRQGHFSEEQIEGVAERTLEILCYLDSLNPPVVHRDIKPSNLLLDEDGEVYLVDFGAVQDVAERTISGGSTVAGTFGYMAPEQLHGRAQASSDLYALGMTLVHLASGRHPSALEQRGLKVDFRGIVDLSPQLEDFIDRLIEPNPEDRFETPEGALAYLRSEVPLAPDLTELGGGPSIAQTVRDRERAAAERERAAREKRRRTIANRADRVSVEMSDDELLIRVRPRRLSTTMTVAAIGIFGFFNPGFAIAGGFPFFGQHWPIFANNWLGRWIIWGLFVLLACAGAVFFLTPPRHFRLSREGFFMAYDRNSDNPDDAGRFEHFQVEIFAPSEDEAPDAAAITLTDENDLPVFHERLENLSADDIDLLDELPTDWIHAPKTEATTTDDDVVFSGTSTTGEEEATKEVREVHEA